ERRNEIANLTSYFMDRYARRYNRPSRQLSTELQQLFQTYDWPGNIRELENLIKRIVILQDEQLVVREVSRAPRSAPAYASAAVGSGGGSDSVPAADDADDCEGEEEEEPAAETAVATAPVSSRLGDVAKAAAMKAERALIEDTLRQHQWNRRRAATQLGVS